MSLNSDFPNAPTGLRIALRVLTFLAFVAGIAAAFVVVICLMSRSFMLFLPSVAVCIWLFALGFALLKLKPWVRWGAPVLVYLLVFVIGIIMLTPFWVPKLQGQYPEIGEIALSALPMWTVAGLLIFGLIWCLWQLGAHSKSFTSKLSASRTRIRRTQEAASGALNKDDTAIGENPGFVINLAERSPQVPQATKTTKPNQIPEIKRTNVTGKPDA